MSHENYLKTMTTPVSILLIFAQIKIALAFQNLQIKGYLACKGLEKAILFHFAFSIVSELFRHMFDVLKIQTNGFQFQPSATATTIFC